MSEVINWIVDNLWNIVTFIIALFSIIMQFRKDKKQDENDKIESQKQSFSKLKKRCEKLEIKIAKIETELKWLAQITPSVNKLIEILEQKKKKNE